MIRGLVVLLCLGAVSNVPASAAADDVETVLNLWGAQSGPWTGYIDIYGHGSDQPQRVDLETTWDSVVSDGATTVTKTETFQAPSRNTSSVTLMFAGSDPGTIATPYFVNGNQQDFRFAVQSVTVDDEIHWTTTIASPDGQETYEGRTAVLRYVRTRNGNQIENTKEVNFLDDDDDTFELRSLVRQTLSSPQATER